MKTIDQFTGNYHYLSNFAASPMMVFDHVLETQVLVQTVEHGFQADKTVVPQERKAILNAGSPGKAKALGRKASLRSDWENVKIARMRYWLRLKFQRPEFHERLLATGTAKLIEGNTWEDRFWGVCGGKGQNWLGKLLMEIRQEYSTSILET
jgi:hypothetical protein